MDLLTAVNRILPALGEHPVTSIDIKHPTLAILLPKIATKIEDITLPGYWFNTFQHTVYPDAEGEIALPAETLSFIAHCHNVSVRGTRLYNMDTMSYVFTEAVTGELITRLAFDELPESVASLVWYSALVDSYIIDIGLTDEVRMWQSQVMDAQRRFTSEHLRNKRYSTTKTERFMRLRRALRA